MNDQARKTRLEDLTSRRDTLRDTSQKLSGRLEGARETVGRIEEESRSRKVEPDQLGPTITQLEERFDQEADKAEAEIKTAEEALRPFAGEVT